MALHGTLAEVAELGSAAFRHFGLVWRRHTKIQIGMAAAIPAKQLPAPLPVTRLGSDLQTLRICLRIITNEDF